MRILFALVVGVVFADAITPAASAEKIAPLNQVCAQVASAAADPKDADTGQAGFCDCLVKELNSLPAKDLRAIEFFFEAENAESDVRETMQESKRYQRGLESMIEATEKTRCTA